MVGGLTSPRHLDSWNLPAWGNNQLHTLGLTSSLAHLPPTNDPLRADVGPSSSSLSRFFLKKKSSSRVTSIKPDSAGGQTDSYLSISNLNSKYSIRCWMDGWMDVGCNSTLHLSLPIPFYGKALTHFLSAALSWCSLAFCYHTPRDHGAVLRFELEISMAKSLLHCYGWLACGPLDEYHP